MTAAEREDHVYDLAGALGAVVTLRLEDRGETGIGYADIGGQANSRNEVTVWSPKGWDDPRAYVCALHELGHVSHGHCSMFYLEVEGNLRETEAEAWLFAIEECREELSNEIIEWMLGPHAFGSKWNRQRPAGEKTYAVYNLAGASFEE